MSDDNYLFVDGSFLLGDIHRLWQQNGRISGKQLNATLFYRHFVGYKYRKYHGEGYKRFTIYFVKGEGRLRNTIVLPSFAEPNSVEDFQIKYCGKRVQGGKRFQDWIDQTQPPNYVIDRINKAEKAVDTQICCDALQLAASNRLNRLFLYTNDYDFLPLFSTLKSMGVNISLFRLFKDRINRELVEQADSFCVPSREELEKLFDGST